MVMHDDALDQVLVMLSTRGVTHGGMQRRLRVVTMFSCTKPSSLHYKKRARLTSTTHHILEQHLTTSSCSLYIVLVLVFGDSKSYLESLSPWNKEQLLV